MDRARVAIFEDYKSLGELVARILETHGHEVVANIATMEEAMRFIGGLEAGDVDVAIVDGNLSEGDRSGKDGARMTTALKEVGRISVIGFSGTRDVEGVDYSVAKNGRPAREIPAIIASIET